MSSYRLFSTITNTWTGLPVADPGHNASLNSDPLLAPHEFVGLEGWNENGKRIPVLLADEISTKFPCPRICYIFFFGVLGANCMVNMMPDLVEKYMGENEVPKKRYAKRHSF